MMNPQPPSASPAAAPRERPRGRAGRKDRFNRFRSARLTNLRITARDVALLRFLDRHRLADMRQLWLAVGRRHWRNLRAFKGRLQKLFHGEYVVRPPAQRERQLVRRLPSTPLVYALGVNGHRRLYPHLWRKPRTGS
jgi:hypothetical protein